MQDGTARKILSLQRSNPADEEERLSEACLVLDEVDLSDAQFGLVKTATINFLRRNGGVLAQPVCILWAKNDGVYASTFPTTNGNHLALDIESGQVFKTEWMFHPRAEPGVDFRDADWSDLVHAVYGLAVKWRDKPGRKALIWLG